VALPAYAAPPKLILSGAVIRYDKYSQNLSAEQWQQILDQISQLKITTLIIQYHHYVPRKAADTHHLPEFDFLPGQAPIIAAPSAKPLSKTESAETKSGESGAAEQKFSPAGSMASPRKGAKPVAGGVSASVKARAAEPSLDATNLILNYADAHHMNVYLGLWMDINWFANLDVMDQLAHNLSVSKADIIKLQEELTSKKSPSAGSDSSMTPTQSAAEIKDAEAAIAVCKRGLSAVQEELDEKSVYFAAKADGQLAGPSIKMADTLLKLYGKHASFVGWYFPEEIWDAAFSSETIAVLNPLLKFISGHCREISADHPRAFVMSPHASRLHYDSVDAIVKSQTELLKNSGVDILMLQDSIGDLNLKEDDDISVRLKKHFTAFKQVCDDLKIKLWADLESYEQINQQKWDAERKPTNIARFKKQFQYTYPYLDPADPFYVVFDYLHFFSLLDAKYPEAEARAALYDSYKREFVDGNFSPPPPASE
jgi:hypothetical protein